MHVEQQGILDDILENPADETNYDVLTDWLLDNDRPAHAELVRVQRSLVGMPEGPERLGLEARGLQLLREVGRPCVPRVTNSVGMELVLIPAGAFWLGSPDEEEGRYNDESPRRLVEVSRPFLVGTYPVTQQEYQRVMGHNPSAFSPTGRLAEVVNGTDTGRHPVEQVTWLDAVEFCQRLSESGAEVEAGRRYRLPTEAEWEYACRGGLALCQAFPFGPTISTAQANYRATARQPGSKPRHTTPVDAFPANGFGLHDLVGNTWEWCADWYSSDAYSRNPTRDPTGPSEGERRNARGGTYNLETRRVRSADRSSFDPEQKDSDLGFRVVCVWRGK